MPKVLLAALLAIAGVLAIWSFTTSAQVIDDTPCQESCHEQHGYCVTACGERDNPVECEEGCDDALETCLEECG